MGGGEGGGNEQTTPDPPPHRSRQHGPLEGWGGASCRRAWSQRPGFLPGEAAWKACLCAGRWPLWGGEEPL